MEEFLRIRARLPRPAGLELCARILADRPYWDVELDEEGLSTIIPLIHGQVDTELTTLEEACRSVERMRNGLEIELDVGRVNESQACPAPPALGPWRLSTLDPGEQEAQAPSGRELFLPPTFSFSRRLWSEEALLFTAIADHLTPPPGAPETRGKAALIVESALPLAPLAANQAGAGSISLITDEQSAPALFDLLTINLVEPGRMECLTLPFKNLSRKREDWLGHFGLIAVHLSPYLAARRLKSLARWLHPHGALIIGGFSPGAQTALLLRSAAKAGLELSYSVNDGDWAAMKLRHIPKREALPPLTGSVVPELVDLPPEEIIPAEAEEAMIEDGLELPGENGAEADEISDEDSLIVEEEEEDE